MALKDLSRLHFCTGSAALAHIKLGLTASEQINGTYICIPVLTACLSSDFTSKSFKSSHLSTKCQLHRHQSLDRKN